MRIDFPSSFSKVAKYLFIGYVFLSVVYTAKHFYSSHSQSPSQDTNGIFPRGPDDKTDFTNQHPVVVAAGQQQDLLNTPSQQQQQQSSQQQQVSVPWSGGVGDKDVSQSMSEQFLMSKVFSDAMGPSDLKPYYFKAQKVPEQEDITMATLVTRNRFKVLSRLATHYKGPISAAVHVNDDDTKEETIEELRALYAVNPDLRDYVDIHLIVDKFDRQFNMWRNVAKFFARTDYIMMLDVDFHLCTDFRKSIRNNPAIMDKLRAGKTALVVPAFEYLVQDDGLDWRTFPTTKAQLLQEVEEDKIDMFHKSWLRGHGSTNYTQWYQTPTDSALAQPYKVVDYNFSYEPYIIYKKEGSPWCDERFIGYGANKAACLYEIYLSGIDYYVLPADFLIHQTHEYPEETRRKERQYNRKLYSNFREELCLRYSRLFVATGAWDEPLADNLKTECQKIRGFRSTIKGPTEA